MPQTQATKENSTLLNPAKVIKLADDLLVKLVYVSPIALLTLLAFGSEPYTSDLVMVGGLMIALIWFLWDAGNS